jgi:capsule polysaccharide export protein KpsE/RkpR
VPDEPTLGEVVRRLEDVRQDLKEDVQALGARLDGKVSADVLRLEQKAQDDAVRALTERVKSLEEAAKERDRQRAADRRLILTGLIVPILLVLLQAYLAAKGAGS